MCQNFQLYFSYTHAQITHSRVFFLPLVTVHFSEALECNRLIQKNKTQPKRNLYFGQQKFHKDNLNPLKSGCFLLLKYLLLREGVKKSPPFAFLPFWREQIQSNKIVKEIILTYRPEVIICKNNLKEISLLCRLHQLCRYCFF